MEDPITGRPRSRDGIIFGLVLIAVILLLVLLLFPFPGGLTGVTRGSSTPVAGNPVAVVDITLTNSQFLPTPKNFDQELNVDWTEYSSYLNENLSNVAFYSSTNFSSPYELHAWVENGAFFGATQSTVWVNLSTNIVPAHGTLNIYMVFKTKNATFSRYFGEAPNLSPSYGLHDNGQAVFSLYDNFAGNSLNQSKWIVVNGGSGAYSVKNGITITENNLVTDMRVVSLNRYSGIVEGMVTYQDYGSFRGTGMELATVFPTQSTASQYDYDFITGYRFFASDNHPLGTVGGFIDSDVVGNGTTVGHNILNPPSTPYLMTVEWPRTGLETWLNNYVTYITATNSSINATSAYVSLYAGADHGNIGTISFSFVRVRPLPPNDVMPIASILRQASKLAAVSSGVFSNLPAITTICDGDVTEIPFQQQIMSGNAQYASHFESTLSILR